MLGDEGLELALQLHLIFRQARRGVHLIQLGLGIRQLPLPEGEFVRMLRLQFREGHFRG